MSYQIPVQPQQNTNQGMYQAVGKNPNSNNYPSN